MALGSRKFIYWENLNCIACKNGSICEWKRAKTQNFSRFEFPEKFQIDVVFSISSFDYRKFALVLWGTFHLLFQKFDFSYFSPSATFLKHPNVWSLRSMLACINDRFAFTHFSIQFHSCWTLIISFFSFENGEVFVDFDFFLRSIDIAWLWRRVGENALTIQCVLFPTKLSCESASSWLWYYCIFVVALLAKMKSCWLHHPAITVSRGNVETS